MTNIAFPDFQPYFTSVDGPTGEIKVRVTPDAFKVWWGADVGPQDEAGLVLENWKQIASIAHHKFSDGEVLVDGFVEVSDADVEE